MKRLKVWDIDSKIWNKFKENISFSKVYFREIFFLNFGSYLFFIFIFAVSFGKALLVFPFFVLFTFIALNYLGKYRHRELNTIKKIIHRIRENEFSSPDEIILGKYLVELEGEIKSMFLRTQNDILNLKKLEQVRTEFLGNVSHELRTPIFAIQGFIETLLGGALNDDRVNKSFLEKAGIHTQNLNNLLNDLIDISMIESGQMKMSFRYFNISEFLEQLIVEFIPLAEEKGLELKLSLNKQNLQLYGDKNRLKQVFVNLIQNAIKYTEEGRVEIIVVEEGKCGKITIRDTGYGIPAADLNRIFERFYRVDKDRSRAIGGTGLGLAIVKHILEAHNSKIEVQSILGLGSEFSFKLKK
ncbi:MAG: ATP-binding protein [bacterium]